jgi:hypothetical protein
VTSEPVAKLSADGNTVIEVIAAATPVKNNEFEVTAAPAVALERM